jgi:hypothetical protein
MYIPRSLLAFATLLSFTYTARAAVALDRIENVKRRASEQSKVEDDSAPADWSWGKIFKRQDSSSCDAAKTERDIFKRAESDDVQTVCNRLLNISPAAELLQHASVTYGSYSRHCWLLLIVFQCRDTYLNCLH